MLLFFERNVLNYTPKFFFQIIQLDFSKLFFNLEIIIGYFKLKFE